MHMVGIRQAQLDGLLGRAIHVEGGVVFVGEQTGLAVVVSPDHSERDFCKAS